MMLFMVHQNIYQLNGGILMRFLITIIVYISVLEQYPEKKLELYHHLLKYIIRVYLKNRREKGFY
jgi:hypothetical protein